MAVPIRFCVNQFGGLQRNKKKKIAQKHWKCFFISVSSGSTPKIHIVVIFYSFLSQIISGIFALIVGGIRERYRMPWRWYGITVLDFFFMRMSGKFHSKPEPYDNEGRMGMSSIAKKSDEKKNCTREKLAAWRWSTTVAAASSSQTVAKCKKYGRIKEATNRWGKTTTTTATKYTENK